MATQTMINTLSRWSIIVNEILTSLFFAILAVPCLSEALKSKEKTGIICIFILIASMMASVLFSIAGIVKQVLQLCKKRNQMKIRPEPILENKEINNIFTKAYPDLAPHFRLCHFHKKKIHLLCLFNIFTF